MSKRISKKDDSDIRNEIEQLKARLEELKIEEIKKKAKEKKDEVEEFVRKKPLLSLAIAVGAGIILGRLLSD